MSFKRFWIHEFYVAEPTGENDWGDKTYESPRKIKGRYVEGGREIRDQDGNVLASRDVIRTDVEVSTEARIWPPGADHTKPEEARTAETAKGVPSTDGRTTLYRIEL